MKYTLKALFITTTLTAFPAFASGSLPEPEAGASESSSGSIETVYADTAARTIVDESLREAHRLEQSGRRGEAAASCLTVAGRLVATVEQRLEAAFHLG